MALSSPRAQLMTAASMQAGRINTWCWDIDNEKENECYDTKRYVRLGKFIIGVWEERANAMPVNIARKHSEKAHFGLITHSSSYLYRRSIAA